MFHGVNRRINGIDPAHHNHRYATVHSLNALQQFDAAHAGQANIRNNQIDSPLFKYLESAFSSRGDDQFDFLILVTWKVLFHCAKKHLDVTTIVFDEQDRKCLFFCRAHGWLHLFMTTLHDDPADRWIAPRQILSCGQSSVSTDFRSKTGSRT